MALFHCRGTNPRHWKPSPIPFQASPLSKGGTLDGEQALGKDASEAMKKAANGMKAGGTYMQITEDGFFRDDRWVDGCWDFIQFKDASTGETNWDAVIDAEMARRYVFRNEVLKELSPFSCLRVPHFLP